MIEKYQEWRDRTERKFLTSVLKRNGWNLSWSSKELGIHRQTLLGKINRLEIQRPRLIQRTFYGHLVTSFRNGTIPKFKDYPGRNKTKC